MKLIELLARELKEWPNDPDYDVTSMTQRADGDIDTWDRTGHSFTGGEWFISGTIPVDRFNFENGVIADDHTTAIVTRDEWVVGRHTAITPTLETMLTEWRDLEARAQAAQAEADALFEHAGQCHGEIVVRLAELGWGAPRMVPGEPVVTLDTSLDMSDWSNWQVGDIIRVLDDEGDSELRAGHDYPIFKIDDEPTTLPIQLLNDRTMWLYRESMLWISRPSTQP